MYVEQTSFTETLLQTLAVTLKLLTLPILFSIKDGVQHPLRNALLNGHLDLAKHIIRKYGSAIKGTAKVLHC